MHDLQPLIDTLRRDGFVMLPGFFPRETAETARQELMLWYERDLAERAQKRVAQPHYDGVAGHTVLTEPSHLMLDAYTRSPVLDGMFETFLESPTSSFVLRALAGERIKLRGFNVRRMTGAFDPPPAHEWHRDSPGEIGIGFLLTDVPPGEHGATAFVRGSHEFPYDPRLSCLLSPPYLEGDPIFLKLNPLNRLLARRALKGATGATGVQGDAYLFINDLWHGRQPNLHGAQSMVVLIGAFPTEFPYPDEVRMPAADVLERLPPAVREVVRQDRPPNPPSATILGEMLARRRPVAPLSLFYLAALERNVADVLSAVTLPIRRVFRRCRRFLRGNPPPARAAA